jgi:predicted nucleic acid-binding protein
VVVDPSIIHAAIETSILSAVSFWDALIVAAAESAQCDLLYTEDLNHGQVIRGVKIVNPYLKE